MTGATDELEKLKETAARVIGWLEYATSTGRYALELLKKKESELKELQIELTKQTHLAQAEHKRADEAVLDLRNEIGKNRADVRHCIVRYIEHLAEDKVAYKESGSLIGHAELHCLSRWIRGGSDLTYESERQETVDEPTLMLRDSWEEKCIIQGHAPLCEKMYYKDSNLCSCGRERKQLQTRRR